MSETMTTSASSSRLCGWIASPKGAGIGAPSRETMRGGMAGAPVALPVSCDQAVPTELSTSNTPVIAPGVDSGTARSATGRSGAAEPCMAPNGTNGPILSITDLP